MSDSRSLPRHPIADKPTRKQIAEARAHVNAGRAELYIAQIMLFGSWLKDMTAPLWSSTLTRFVSPAFGIVGSVFSAIFSWREFHKSKQKHALAAAIVETAAGAAMIVAAVGVMASIAALSFVAPMLFIAAIGLKTLFSFGSTIFHLVEARRAGIGGNNDARAVSLSKARHAAVETLVGAAVTAAAVVLMLFAAPVIQTVALSIAVGAAGVGLIHCLYNIFTNYNKKTAKLESEAMGQDTEYTRQSTNLLVGNKFGHRNDNQDVDAHNKNEQVGSAPEYQQQQQQQPPLQEEDLLNPYNGQYSRK